MISKITFPYFLVGFLIVAAPGMAEEEVSHAFGPEQDEVTVAASIPETAPRLPNTGCQNERREALAHTAKTVASRLFLSQREYHVNGVGVGECGPDSVASLLGKPVPMYIRAPDPVCGVSLHFSTREEARAFLNSLWDGKVQPDRAQGAKIKLTSADDPTLTSAAYVPLCPEISGDFVAAGKKIKRIFDHSHGK